MRKLGYLTCLALVTSQISFAGNGRRRGGGGGHNKVRSAAKKSAHRRGGRRVTKTRTVHHGPRSRKTVTNKTVHHTPRGKTIVHKTVHHGPVHGPAQVSKTVVHKHVGIPPRHVGPRRPPVGFAVARGVARGVRAALRGPAIAAPAVMKHQPVVVGQDVFCYAAYRNFIYRVYASHFQMSADRNTRDAMEKIGHHVGFTSVNLLKFLYQVEDSGFADTRMDEAVKVWLGCQELTHRNLEEFTIILVLNIQATLLPFTRL